MAGGCNGKMVKLSEPLMQSSSACEANISPAPPPRQSRFDAVQSPEGKEDLDLLLLPIIPTMETAARASCGVCRAAIRSSLPIARSTSFRSCRSLSSAATASTSSLSQVSRPRRRLNAPAGRLYDVGYSLRRPLITSARRQTSSNSSNGSVELLGQSYQTDDYYNLPTSIVSRLTPTPALPYAPSHPLSLLRSQIESHLSAHKPIKAPNPIVSTDLNFGQLGFPEDHPGRSPTDTYYLNRTTCLRTHTSAHEVETFAQGHEKWLLTADVYRRDEIDASHYPVFHQMESASIWKLSTGDFEAGGIVERECEEMEEKLRSSAIEVEDNVSVEEAGGWQACHEADPSRRRAAELSLRHLKATLNGLALELFGERHAADVASSSSSSVDAPNDPLRVRWISATFPFTSPSLEVEVWFRGQWLEILGCGIVMQKTLDNAQVHDKLGWAFGLGLERIAMVLYSIPDIRLFWSKDRRFLDQFKQREEGTTKLPPPTEAGVSQAGGNVSTRRRLLTFKPFSKYPPCYKDVSFWLPNPSTAETARKAFHENDLHSLVREATTNSNSDGAEEDLVESVALIDSFTHPKTGKKSLCFRINYRSMERSLENEEVNALHAKVIEGLKEGGWGVEIR